MSNFWAKPGRTDTFYYKRISWNDWVEREFINCITDCTVSESAFTSLKQTGKVNYKTAADKPFFLGDDLLRIYSISRIGEELVKVCHGTLFATSGTVSYKGGLEQGTLELYSVLKVLQDELTSSTLTIPKGTRVTKYVDGLIKQRYLNTSTTPSDYELKQDRTFDFGESMLNVFNELLSTIGYRSLYTDAYGNVCITPSIELNAQTCAVSMSDTDPTVSITSTTFDNTFDTSDIPNRVVVIGEKRDSTQAGSDPVSFRAVAENTSLASPWSIPNRKKVICRCEKLQDVSSQAYVNEKAKEYLKNGMLKVEAIEIEHCWMPFQLFDAIDFDFSRSGKVGKYSAVKRTVSMEPGIPCTTTMRRFVDLSEVGR